MHLSPNASYITNASISMTASNQTLVGNNATIKEGASYPESSQSVVVGQGQHYLVYDVATQTFTVTLANATAGAVYSITSAGITYKFTVTTTITGSTTLVTTGAFVPPLSSGTLTRTSGTGDLNISYSAYTAGGSATVQVSKGISSLTYANASSLAVGEMLFLYANSYYQTAGPYQYGWIGVIESIVGTTVTLNTESQYSFTVGQLVELKAINNSHIIGVNVDQRSSSQGQPSLNGFGIGFLAGVNCSVENCFCQSDNTPTCATTGISVVGINMAVRNNKSINYRFTNSGAGYDIAISGVNIIVEGNECAGAKHGITAATRTTIDSGLYVRNNILYTGAEARIDFHGNVRGGSIRDNTIYVGPGGHGIENRGQDIEIDGNYIVIDNSTGYQCYGITLYENSSNNIAVTNNQIYNNTAANYNFILAYYRFTVLSANAPLNAVYTDGYGMFTVKTAISGQTTLDMDSANAPIASSGQLTRVSGSGDAVINYTAYSTIGSANATAGDTYTNNSVTYTVIKTIVNGTSLLVTGTSAPTMNGTLTWVSGSGDTSITFCSRVTVSSTAIYFLTIAQTMNNILVANNYCEGDIVFDNTSVGLGNQIKVKNNLLQGTPVRSAVINIGTAWVVEYFITENTVINQLPSPYFTYCLNISSANSVNGYIRDNIFVMDSTQTSTSLRLSSKRNTVTGNSFTTSVANPINNTGSDNYFKANTLINGINYSNLAIDYTCSQLTVPGTSGSAVFSQPLAQVNDKKVIIYCNSLVGTIMYTFLTPFVHTPALITPAPISGLTVASISATVVTLTGTSGSGTGFLILEGF